MMEKAGRTVCQICADSLRGREYPLRNGIARASFGAFQEREQLSMIELRETRLNAPSRGRLWRHA